MSLEATSGEPYRGPPPFKGRLTRHLYLARQQEPWALESPDAQTAPSLERVYALYSAYVAGTAAKILGRDDEVEDVVQEVFLACARRKERFPSLDDARRWLSTVTVRTACHRLKRRRRWRWIAPLEQSHFDIPSLTLSPEERSELHRLYRVLDKLPPRQRSAWVLRHLQGERLDDIADACGCSLATVKRWIGAADAAVAEVFGDA